MQLFAYSLNSVQKSQRTALALNCPRQSFSFCVWQKIQTIFFSSHFFPLVSGCRWLHVNHLCLLGFQKTLTSVSKDADCCIDALQYICQHRLSWLLVLGVRPCDIASLWYKRQFLLKPKRIPSSVSHCPHEIIKIQSERHPARFMTSRHSESTVSLFCSLLWAFDERERLDDDTLNCPV